MGRSEVAVVIPAFNEAATIVEVVCSVSSFGHPIVVDDHSSDRTAALAENAGAIVLRHESNRGYDQALESGFAEAQKRGFLFVITVDADGQHDPNLIQNFIAHLEIGNDLVIGIRPRKVRFSELLFAFYTRLRFGLYDPLCGMKAYRMSLYRERGWFDSYGSVGTELAIYAMRKKKPFVQIPVPISERKGIPRFAKLWAADYRILRAMVLSMRNSTKYQPGRATK